MLRFAAALAVGLSASMAAAADLPNGDASPGLLRGQSAYNWSGIYAGVSAGLAADKISAEATQAVFGDPRSHGFIGGVQAGFNKQAGSFVVGLEADMSLSNARQTRGAGAGAYGAFAVTGSGELESSLANLGTVRGRVGYAIDNVMIYATAGYALARHRLALSGALTAKTGGQSFTAAQAGTTSNTMSGLVLGAGVEYAFARGMTLKAEYLHAQFGASTFFGNTWAAAQTKASLNLFRTGLNFRI